MSNTNKQNRLIYVGKYKSAFNALLGLNMACKSIYRSKGLPAHMLKSKHAKCLKYIDYIPDIIDCPDYIGINPNENSVESIELIKKYRDNVIVGIKLDKDNDYWYVSTMYDIQESKIKRRLYSGRIKKFVIDKTENA